MNQNQQLIAAYQAVRDQTEALCQPLAIEDYVIQSINDVSPPKWHLAHTTWFFETFILAKQVRNYQLFDPLYQYLFNSYYQGIGLPYPRIERGLLSRPTVETVYAYRAYVDKHMKEYVDQLSDDARAQIQPLMTLGLHHEQQHQELLMMDIKHNFSIHPDFPVYQKNPSPNRAKRKDQADFVPIQGGIVEMGHVGDEFSYDNELPRHQLILKPYLLSNRLVTNGEYAEFIAAGGYQTPD